MEDATIHPAVTATGLVPVVKLHLLDTLAKIVPQWLAEPAADWKRIRRPTGAGSFSISIEPYQGVQSWISFRKKFIETDEMLALERVLRQHQPELLGYVTHDYGSQLIQDSFALCFCLSQEVVRRIGPSSPLEAASASVISDLDRLLTARIAEREVLTALNGLRLPDGVERIDLDKGLYIRLLTADEISELGSNDISSEGRFDFTTSLVTTALISETTVSIRLSPGVVALNPDLTSHLIHQEQIDNVLGALHILKKGRVGVLASFTTIRPTILPNMSGHSSAPLLVNPFSSMELSQGDVDNLIRLYKSLARTQRDELNIAAARLLDAESRMSPIDALLDAVIGLEVLLNPNDRSELSFRVALNYAYLGPEAERRKRYESVRDVQLTRNRVVHGGLNLKSKDAFRLHEQAELAKACLRDCTARFLTDASLTGTQALDAEFWLDRVIPPRADP